jgi:formylglycine-generating enzyme required for sulfatase activity
MSSRKLKVFLCHSTGDKPAVRALYKRLQADGFDPWLDEEDLLPGQEWEKEIPQAVRAAGAIIVCLSRNSITKEGYVQKEIGDALNVAEEKPEGTLFIFPLKLEECEIPRRLNRWQAGRLFAERGYERLVQALKIRADALGVLGFSTPALAQSIRNSIGMEFILIPAGEFQMGSEDGGGDEKPVHRVRITRPFYLGKYPVTQAQWEAVMGKGNNPSCFTEDPNGPVEQVSWQDAQDFLQRLSAKEGGQAYRLPTEAEWEYAARAGTTTAYSFGDDPRLLDKHGWYAENSGETTHPVGQLKPNAWGLYDMHGNVWEWVQDWYDSAYYQKSPVDDPQGPEEGTGKVLRGGSWTYVPRSLRVSGRRWGDPGGRRDLIGFRCAR